MVGTCPTNGRLKTFQRCFLQKAHSCKHTFGHLQIYSLNMSKWNIMKLIMDLKIFGKLVIDHPKCKVSSQLNPWQNILNAYVVDTRFKKKRNPLVLHLPSKIPIDIVVVSTHYQQRKSTTVYTS